MVRCLAILLAATALSSGRTDDWGQFRGPTGDGISTADDPPLKWGPAENIHWRVAIPGRGRSSPVIAGERIWLTTALEVNPRLAVEGRDRVTFVDRAELMLVCLERATGKELYRTSLFKLDRPPPVHELNSYATPTPVFGAGRVYCDFGASGIAGVDGATGKILWTNRVAFDQQLGPASSPVLWKDLLVLVRDGMDRQFVAALDTKTGDVVWKTDRPPLADTPDKFKQSYSTPIVVHGPADSAQVIVPGPHWVVSYEVQTGRELWRVRHGTGFSIGPRPVAGNGMVYVCTGMTRQLWAIRLGGSGDVTGTHVAWKTDSGIGMLASPLLAGRELYTLSDQGLLTCRDAFTGEELGRRGLGISGAASPVLAEGRIYVFGQKGKGIKR